jgi:ferredoxin
MDRVVTRTFKDKCKTFGRCLKLAPESFVLDAQRKVDVVSPSATTAELLLKVAKSCPYRAIGLFDEATGEQIFPRPGATPGMTPGGIPRALEE